MKDLKDLEMPSLFNDILANFITNSMLDIRNDCSAVGQWKFGDDGYLGKELQFVLLDWQNYYGRLGQGSSDDWMALVFVPGPKENKIPKMLTYRTFIKTEPLNNFKTLIYQLKSEGKKIPLGIFTATLTPKKNEMGNYSSIRWDWTEATNENYDFFKTVAEFLKTQPLLTKGVPDSLSFIPKDIDVTTEKQIKQKVKQHKWDKLGSSA